MSILVENYGLHTSPEGVVYLHQGRSASNLIGLKAQSPFEIIGKKRACPHMVHSSAPIPDRAHWRIFMRMFTDPLVQALLPIPKEKTSLVPFLNDPNNELSLHLIGLIRMSSPLFQMIHPISKLTPKQIISDLTLTNLAPLVLTHVKPSDQELMYQLAAQSRMLPRKLLFVGDPAVVIHTPLQRLQTTFWDLPIEMLSSLPMESLGAVIVRRYARNEAFDMDFVKREDE